MLCEPDHELKSRLKCAGVSYRAIAQALRMPYGTVSSVINGFTPYRSGVRSKILDLVKAAELRRMQG